MHEKLIQDITKYLIKDLIPEITISKPVPNNLQHLLILNKKIHETEAKDQESLTNLAIKCAELVLPIWEYYHPNDKRVRQTIESAKKGQYNNDADRANSETDQRAASWVASVADDAADMVYYKLNPEWSKENGDKYNFKLFATEAVRSAILATKIHFDLLNEITVNKPARIHNLNKGGVKFENIKVGDIIEFDVSAPQRETLRQKVVHIKEKRITTIDLDDYGKPRREDALDWWDDYDLENYYKRYDELGEITINRPTKVWDLDKEGTKFEDIQVGDMIYLTPLNGSEKIKQKVTVKWKHSLETKGTDNIDNNNDGDWWRKSEIESYYTNFNLKEEHEFGDYLFGGEDTGVAIKWYPEEMEPDTKAEKELFLNIKKYVDSDAAGYSTMNLDSLIPLFKELKKEYPTIMDPKVPENKYIYRGTNISKEELARIDDKDKKHLYEQGHIVKNIEYSSRRKVQSWSLSYYTAAGFAAAGAEQKGGATVVMRAKASNAELFLNPKFLDNINSQFEDEVFNITNPIMVDMLVIDEYDENFFNSKKKPTGEITEITISKPVPNNLPKIKEIIQQMKSLEIKGENREEMINLGIKIIELTIPLWKHYYPDNDCLEETITLAKQGLYNTTIMNKGWKKAESDDNLIARWAVGAVLDISALANETVKDFNSEERKKYINDRILEIEKGITKSFSLYLNKDYSWWTYKQIDESKDDFKTFIKYIDELLCYCCKDLNITRPKVKIINNRKYSQENKSFGGYQPGQGQIYLVIKNRNLSDVCRTLAHEIKHYEQDLKGILTPESGKDGSEHENECNAYSGRIMREFNKQHPEILAILNEIVVKNPISFPLEIDDEEHYLKMIRVLHQKGYKWDNDDVDFNPYDHVVFGGGSKKDKIIIFTIHKKLHWAKYEDINEITVSKPPIFKVGGTYYLKGTSLALKLSENPALFFKIIEGVRAYYVAKDANGAIGYWCPEEEITTKPDYIIPNIEVHEITVGNPNELSFPMIIDEKGWKRILPILSSKKYPWFQDKIPPNNFKGDIIIYNAHDVLQWAWYNKLDEITVGNPTKYRKLRKFQYYFTPKDWKEIEIKMTKYWSEEGMIEEDWIEYLASQTSPKDFLASAFSWNEEYWNNLYLRLPNTFINEITVGNPNIKFPLVINSKEEWDKILPTFIARKYKWMGNNPDINNFSPYDHMAAYHVITIFKKGNDIISWSPGIHLTEEENNNNNPSDYEIFCDLDGVLTNFDARFKQYARMGAKEYIAKHSEKEFWAFITKAGEKYWSEMPWMPEGKQLWEYISKYNPKILSSPSRDASSRIGKKRWIERELPNTELILSNNKANYSGFNKILIDDREDNIYKWKAAGGIGILFTSTAQIIEDLKKLGLL